MSNNNNQHRGDYHFIWEVASVPLSHYAIKERTNIRVDQLDG